MDVRSLLPNPYEELYVYYLEGRVSTVPETFRSCGYIGNWDEDGFSFLFFSSPAEELVKTMVSQDETLVFIDSYAMTCEEWHGDKIESYRSGSLCISPPWKIPFINEKGIKHILLDPGVVFGTGRHPTTEVCLGYLESLCIGHTINTVLDIGSGTGLLALGAAALGCGRILALDFNHLAVKTTLNNVRLNAFEDKIIAIQAKAQDFMDLPADLVVANIHYDVMKDLVAAEEFFNKKWYVLSGLLKSETAAVLAALEKMPVTLVERCCPDGVWNTILAERK